MDSEVEWQIEQGLAFPRAGKDGQTVYYFDLYPEHRQSYVTHPVRVRQIISRDGSSGNCVDAMESHFKTIEEYNTYKRLVEQSRNQWCLFNASDRSADFCQHFASSVDDIIEQFTPYMVPRDIRHNVNVAIRFHNAVLKTQPNWPPLEPRLISEPRKAKCRQQKLVPHKKSSKTKQKKLKQYFTSTQNGTALLCFELALAPLQRCRTKTSGKLL